MIKAINAKNEELDIESVYFNTYQDEANDSTVIVIEIIGNGGNLLVRKELLFEELVSCKTTFDRLVHKDTNTNSPMATLFVDDRDFILIYKDEVIDSFQHDPDMYDTTTCGTVNITMPIYDWRNIIYDGIAAYNYFKF